MRHNGTAVAEKISLAEQFKSPKLLLMLLLGLVLVVGVPYLALRTLPGIVNPLTGDRAAPKGDPNAGMDFSDLANLPPSVAQAASQILAHQEPMFPESLMGLPETTSSALIYPVTEAVESVQPTLSWMVFDNPPFRVTVKDMAGEVVATGRNLSMTYWVVPVKLIPGGVYTWEVTAANGNTEDAAFVVMTTEEMEDWRAVRSKFSSSHLALGLAAEHFGLLTLAEREYEELQREHPRAEAPGRLLGNVLALRDPSAAPEP